jgi:SAM-dependent methyltransferase
MTIAIRTNVNGLIDTGAQTCPEREFCNEVALCQSETIGTVLRRLLPFEGKILDAGCGSGRWIYYLRMYGYDVRGLDIRVNGTQRGKLFDPGLMIERGDIFHLPYRDGAFDAVMALGATEQFQASMSEMLAELHRVLKDKHRLFLTVPSLPAAPIWFLPKNQSKVKSLSNNENMNKFPYSIKAFSRLLGKSGFAVESIYRDTFTKGMKLFDYIGLFERIMFICVRFEQS